MKKLLLSTLLMMVLSVSAFADDSYGGKKERIASLLVQAQFESDFKDAKDVTWTTSNKFQKVTFNLNGEEMTAFYNWQNEHIGTAKVVTNYTELSPVALKNIFTDFRGHNNEGYRIVQILKYTTSETNFFLNLRNDRENLIVKVAPNGDTSIFKRLK